MCTPWPLLLTQDVDHAEQQQCHAAAPVPLPDSAQRQLAALYTSLYETLLELGFSTAQVQDALTGVHHDPATQQQLLLSSSSCSNTAAGLDACLDWLCLHVPPAQLPRRFTGSAAAQVAAGSVGVKVCVAC